MYPGKVCQWLTQALGIGEQGLLGQVLIRAFEREPSLRSFTPDRLLEEGDEMKPEGKHCATGKPRLSRQLRPPQGVNYTETDRHFRKPFWACPKNKHSLTRLALMPASAWMRAGNAPPEPAPGRAPAAAPRGNSAALGLRLLHQSPIPLPITVPRWALQCAHICTAAGHPAPVFVSPVTCPSLPIHKPWSSARNRFPSTASSALKNLADFFFFQARKGKEQIKLVLMTKAEFL